jgi:hypothetical protein
MDIDVVVVVVDESIFDGFDAVVVMLSNEISSEYEMIQNHGMPEKENIDCIEAVMVSVVVQSVLSAIQSMEIC